MLGSVAGLPAVQACLCHFNVPASVWAAPPERTPDDDPDRRARVHTSVNRLAASYSSLTPHLQRHMRGRVTEVLIRSQQDQLVSNRELSQEGIDRPYLNTIAPAAVANLGRFDMVVAVGRDRWQRRETMQDRVPLTRAPEPLQ